MNNTNGHTPGPWASDPLGIGALGDVSTADGAIAVAQAQAILPLSAGRPDLERAANARLIAAAPELLEALERISSLTMSMFATTGSLAREAKRIADSAIAKTKGTPA